MSSRPERTRRWGARLTGCRLSSQKGHVQGCVADDGLVLGALIRSIISMTVTTRSVADDGLVLGALISSITTLTATTEDQLSHALPPAAISSIYVTRRVGSSRINSQVKMVVFKVENLAIELHLDHSV